MQDPQVIVGQSYQCRWIRIVPTKRITMEQACDEMAKYWRCTVENARESLLKHGYASSLNRDWRVVGRGFDEFDKW